MEALDPVVGQLQLPADMSNFNPLEDSSLTAFLEDLQEGTFLSLLQDDGLFSDITDCPLSPTKAVPEGNETVSLADGGFPFEDLFGDHGELVEFGIRELDASSHLQEFEVPLETVMEADVPRKRLQKDGSCEKSNPRKSPARNGMTVKERSSSRLATRGSRKRPRVTHVKDPSSESDSDISSTDSEAMEALECFVQPEKRSKPDLLERAQESGHILRCVQHDHSYLLHGSTGVAGAEEGTCSVRQRSMERDSNEEGSSSDTGYETMSTSTSPGNRSTSHAMSLSPVSTSPTTTLPPSPPPHPSFTLPPLPALPPVGPNTDPVALIDARIKHFMCSRQVSLTEEEKETLRAEGLPIPTTLPLTKTEEKALKTVRRKIRNKMAAQESRRRKKEHVQSLEDKVRQYANENLRLKKKMETLESENKTLAAQLKKLHAMVTCTTPPTLGGSRTTQVGACLMVLVLCFALFMGNYGPQRSSTSNDYTTPTVRSRSLLSVENPQNFQKAACDLLSHIFLRDKDPHLPSDDTPPMEVASPFMGHPSQQEEAEGGGKEGGWASWDLLRGIQNVRHRPKLCPGMQQGNDSCSSADA